MLAALLLVAATVAAAPLPTMQTFVQAPGLGPLKGTMLTPTAGGGPMMLIIPGSGPTDRVNKRGMLGSRATVADGNAVTIDDYVTDIESWLASTFLLRSGETDRGS